MDKELRYQILHAVVRDRQFLQKSCHDFNAENFPDKLEKIVVDIGLTYWEQYGEPVGSMLRTDAEAKAREMRLSSDERKKLRGLIDKIQTQQMNPIPVRALQDRVHRLKKDTFFEGALEEIVSAQENNKFSIPMLEGIVDKAMHELSDHVFNTSDFLEEYEGRVLRRQLQAEEKRYPLLLIDPLDSKIRILGRGHFGIWVGPYSSGKSLYLLHTAQAYALQGLNVLYFTLEDPVDVLENRFDACMTDIPMTKLTEMPIKFKRKFKLMRKMMRGRIKIVDATGGGCTLAKIEKIWEQEKAHGFIADAIIIDYDEELESEKKFTGEMARKREFEDIYKGLRRMARKLDVFLWTACQTKAGKTSKRIITGDDIGEDYSKAKKSFIAIGIGQDKENKDVKHLYVMRHRLDRSRFGVDVVTDFERGVAYDREETLKYMRIAD
jgi:hypothetical protein